MPERSDEATKIAWDWHVPRSTAEERRELVDFTADLGFDTLVVGRPEDDLVSHAHERNVRVVAVLSPSPTEEFARIYPAALQAMQPYEDKMLSALQSTDRRGAQYAAHRWFPLIQGGELLCYEHEESRTLLQRRVRELLASCDGVALDGFGFRNHYACFCAHCVERHGGDPARIAEFSEASLVEISRIIYRCAKKVDPEAVVMNHVWPPLNPNPYYGCNLHLDYCTQTISWFFRPSWDMSRVRLEAQLHRSLERRDRNRFVPFIGFSAEPYHLRSPERLAEELAVADEYGDGSFVLCTLEGPWKSEEIRNVVKEACLR